MPVPVFAIVFLLLCLVNSAVPLMPSVLPVYAPVKSVLVEVSTWGLLLAIGALGLGTSVKTIIGLGWRHVTTVLGASAVIFAMVTGGLAADAARLTASVTVSKSAGSTISSNSQSSE